MTNLTKFQSTFFLSFLCGFTVSTSMAQTWTIEVTTREDQLDLPGPLDLNPNNGCSLREAVETANAIMGLEGSEEIPACEPNRGGVFFPDPSKIRILLTLNGEYRIGANFTEEEEELDNARGDFYLYAGLDVVVEKDPEVDGEVILNGFQRDRLFRVEGAANATVTFRNLTFQNGRPVPHDEFANDGGAIRSRNIAALHIERCQFIENQTSAFLLDDDTYDAGHGGAIFNLRSAIFINESVFIQNQTSPREAFPQDANVSTGGGSALRLSIAQQIVVENSSFIENVSDFSGAITVHYGAIESPIEPAIIQHCQFIRNGTFSIFPLFRLRKGTTLIGNLFVENTAVNGILEIGELLENDMQSKVEANVFVANQSRYLIGPLNNDAQLPIQFNTFFQNEAKILDNGNATTNLFGNLISGFANASTRICRWDGAAPDSEVTASQGYNIFFGGNYNCGETHPNDLILDENTEEAWREIIQFPDTEDPDWNGAIELTEGSMARNAIPSDEPLCQNAGPDFLGNRRPESDGSQCDIGALEMDSVLPPDPEEGTGGMGSMPIDPGTGGDAAGGNSAGGSAGEPTVEPPPVGGEPNQGGSGDGGTGGNPLDATGGNAGEPDIIVPVAGEPNAGGDEADPIEENPGGQAIGGQNSGEQPEGGQDETPQGGSSDDPPDNTKGNGKKASGCQCSVKSFTSSATPNHLWFVAGLFSALSWLRKKARRSVKQKHSLR